MNYLHNFIWKVKRGLFPNRKYKDFLFQRVFEDKKDILSLYNALNGTNYTNPDEIEISTLEDAIYMTRKDDMSFIVAATLNLYEHQSTVNPNMPLRGLIYFARQYEAYVEKNKLNIYGRKIVKLPLPQFVIFYNGPDNCPDDYEMRLSDAFDTQNNKFKPMLECTARVININYGHNDQLMKACKRLNDYSYFVRMVSDKLKYGYDLKDALSEAMNDCIENDILADILSKCRSEVYEMSILTDFDPKFYEKCLREEVKEEVREEIKEEVRKEYSDIRLIGMIIKKYAKNQPLTQIADEVEEDITFIMPIYDAIVANPGKNADEIYQLIQKK